MKDYKAGERIEFDKRRYPPLYTLHNSTLMDLFDIIDAEMRQLKTIITNKEAAERDRKHGDRATI